MILDGLIHGWRTYPMEADPVSMVAVFSSSTKQQYLLQEATVSNFRVFFINWLQCHPRWSFLNFMSFGSWWNELHSFLQPIPITRKLTFLTIHQSHGQGDPTWGGGRGFTLAVYPHKKMANQSSLLLEATKDHASTKTMWKSLTWKPTPYILVIWAGRCVFQIIKVILSILSGQNLPIYLHGHTSLSYEDRVIIIGGEEGTSCNSKNDFSKAIYV